MRLRAVSFVLIISSHLMPGADPVATVTLGTGECTFGQVLPPGVATGGISIRGCPCQCDIKTVWPDGSIRFAVLSALVASAGAYPLLATMPATASTWTPAIPAAEVDLVVAGQTYRAIAPAAVSADRWLDGPVALEWRDMLVPTADDGTPHPYLRVLMDRRCYADGAARADITVENDLDATGATVQTYDVAILVAGTTVFQRQGVVQAYLTRWRTLAPVNLASATVLLDFGPAIRAHAVPDYLSTISDDNYSTSTPSFDILQRGGLAYDDMGSPGGRPEIAPYPDWAARFLVHQDPSQRDFLLRTGDLAGSPPLHLRQANGSLVSIDRQPQFWLDSRDQVGDVPVSDQPQGNLSPASFTNLSADLEHVPSTAFIPYIATGDRYYADEMAFWADFGLIGTHPYYMREYSAGILGDGTVRAMAWPLRNLVDAAAYLPDADPMKAYFGAKVINNLAFYDAYVAGTLPSSQNLPYLIPWSSHPPGPLGTSFEITSGDTPGYQGLVLWCQWQQNFLAWAITHANADGFSGGATLRDRMTAMQTTLFSSGPAYPPEDGCPYYPACGTYDATHTDQWTYYTSMASVAATTPNISSSYNQFAGYYDVDGRLSLMIDQNRDAGPAAAALQFLLPRMGDDLITRAGWSLASIPVAPPSGFTAGGSTTGVASASGGTGSVAGAGAVGGSSAHGCGVGGLIGLGVALITWRRRGGRMGRTPTV